MIEIVSPGNKASKNGVRAFVNKACELLEARIHLLIVDPFPPGPRDPNGIHAAIWSEVQDDPFTLPADKPLTISIRRGFDDSPESEDRFHQRLNGALLRRKHVYVGAGGGRWWRGGFVWRSVALSSGR